MEKRKYIDYYNLKDTTTKTGIRVGKDGRERSLQMNSNWKDRTLKPQMKKELIDFIVEKINIHSSPSKDEDTYFHFLNKGGRRIHTFPIKNCHLKSSIVDKK